MTFGNQIAQQVVTGWQLVGIVDGTMAFGGCGGLTNCFTNELPIYDTVYSYQNFGLSTWNWSQIYTDGTIRFGKLPHPKPPNQDACMNSFKQSVVGKAARFFSPITGITEFRDAWPDWTVLPGAKIAILQAAKSVSSSLGDVEFYSLTAGTTTTITAPTAALIEGGEQALSTPAALLIPFATAMDAAARNTCAHLPNIPVFR